MSECTIVMYHYVRDTEKTPYPELKALSIRHFNTQLDWLQETHDIVTYEEFQHALKNGRESSKKAALLTFDDGLIDHYETVLPIFKERGITGVFFVATPTLKGEPTLLNVHAVHMLLAKLGAQAFQTEVISALKDRKIDLDNTEREGIYRYDQEGDIDIKKMLNYELPFDVTDEVVGSLFQKHIGDAANAAKSWYLTPEQITEMSEAGMTIGGHTRSHRVLSRLSVEEQKTELSEAPELVRSLTGQKNVPFCYPYGHEHTFNEDTVGLLKDLGYSSATTTKRETVGFPTDDRYHLSRFDTKDLPPFIEHA